MSEQAGQITIISDLLKRDPAYKDVVDQLEGRLYDRYMVYLSNKPQYNAKTQDIPKQYLALILSFKNTLALNRLAQKYNLSQEQRDMIPEVLWKIFHKEAEIKNLPQMLNSELNIGNIRTAYTISTDIATIYLPISDYLGDVPMTIKRWQYEVPTEAPTISQLIQPKISIVPQQAPETPQIPSSTIVPPPVRQTAPTLEQPAQPTPTITSPQVQSQSVQVPQEDESIPKVQEALARILRPNPMGQNMSGTLQKPLQETKAQPLEKQRESPIPEQPQHAPQVPPQIQYQATSPEPRITPPPSGKSDLEPEYLPDEPIKPVNKGNIIDLKNF